MPVVAWRDDSSGTWQIYVRRWNGGAWVEMGGSASGGGISNTVGPCYWPSVAIGPDGAPLVAWIDDSSGSLEVYVRRWNGLAWEEMGAGSAAGSGISGSVDNVYSTSLAVGPDNTPVVAWGAADSDHSDNNEIYVRYHPPIPLVKWAFVPLTTFSPCLIGPWENEPNNNAAQASGPLCAGRDYFGLPNDRHDVFMLDAAAGPITVNLANHVGRGVQLQLHHQAITPHPIAIDFTGADGYRVALPNAAAGRYYVVIATATPSSSATQYTLTPTFILSD